MNRPIRLLFFLIVAATALGLLALMVAVLAPGGVLGGWAVLKLLVLLAFAGVVPWLGICVGNALFGFAVLLFARDPPRAVLPVAGDISIAPIATPVAIAVTIRNEPMELVLPPLLALLDALRGHGAFTGFILSDTQDPALAAAEAAAVPPGLRYRRRSHNTGFKAGNVMDFLDQHADAFPLTVMLDADSVMTAPAVLRLVRIMQADPRMGIVQHLTVGKPAAAAFPRLFQFGMRAGMRVWATGQALWQGADGPYWGHNAILRSAAFRDHCKLAPLPDGSTILSHDQVEAAMLRAAGYKVCVWAGEDGSLEANPPALPEFLHRDSRWLAGNLQYRHLLVQPGWTAMGRWQLVQAILLFAGAPLYTAILILAAVLAAGGGTAASGPLLALGLAWPLALYAPKLLGYAEILLSARQARRYGGRGMFLLGALAEIGFTLLLDALATPHKTLAMLRLAFGAKPGWLPQNRSDRGVSWLEAARMFWPHTLLGLGVFSGFAAGSWTAVAWAAPFAIGLPLAIPFCVLTASPAFSRGLQRLGVAATPEERACED